MKKQFIIIGLLFNTFGFAQKTKLTAEIESLKKDKALQHATWSICVMNTKKDTAIAEYNSHVSVVPASTLKIVTTAAALSILGSDFIFETQLLYDGVFDSTSGVLKGNIQTESTIITNARHYHALKEVEKSLEDIKKGMDDNLSGDLLASDIRRCLHFMGEITGEVTNEDMLDYIFSKFCIGK